MSKSTRSKVNVAAKFSVRGATAPSGTEFLIVRKAKKSVLLKRADVLSESRALRSRLAVQGMYLSRAEVAELDKFATEVTSLPPKNIIEQPGWTSGSIALPSGQVFAPPGLRFKKAFQLDAPQCRQAGNLDGWLSVVTELNGQNLAVFMLMVGFAAPLIQLTSRSTNFGFELCGDAGNGKTTLLQLMASTIGNPNRNAGSVYFSSCNTTVNATEQTALAHNDFPLLLDDGTQFAAAQHGSARANQFKQFVMFLAQGETKARFQGPSQKRFRLVYVLTTNLPLADVVAELAPVEAGATADRLLSLSLDLRPRGNFDFIPAKYPDSRAFALSLMDGVSRHHGTAMPHFLEALVGHRARNEARLRMGIQERVEEFLTLVRTDRSDASEARVAEAFGLVYAAGELAKYYGALPGSFDCQEAALVAYRLHLATVDRISPVERLKAYAASAGVRDLDKEKARFLTLKEVKSATGFWRTHQSGQSEFVVYPETFKRCFPDWSRVLKDPAIANLVPGPDSRHLGRKRHLRKNRPNERYFVFRLPESGSSPVINPKR